jgi:hypothetical protein
LLERASVSASSIPPWGCCLGSFIVGQACAWFRDRRGHRSRASGFWRRISCVAFVVELLGVGSSRLGVRSVGLAGARSWDRCGWALEVRMLAGAATYGSGCRVVGCCFLPLQRKSRQLVWCTILRTVCCFDFRPVSLINWLISLLLIKKIESCRTVKKL